MKVQHGGEYEPTECNDIEDLNCLVYSGCRKAAAVGTDSYTPDLTWVSNELLHKLDTLSHLLPKFDNSIYGTGDHKVRVRRNGHKRQLVLMHQRLGVPRRGR